MKFVLKNILLLVLCLLTANGFALKISEVYKIKSTITGMVEIKASDLNAKFPELTNIDPRYLHFSKNGEAVPFYIKDTAATWSTNNAILFYAEKNDGFLDKLLYDKAGAALNPYHSMYSDTAVYFLSYDNTKKGNYYNHQSTITSSNWIKEFEYEMIKSFPETYFLGKNVNSGATLSEYTLGEGYSGGMWSLGSAQVRGIETPFININKNVELQTYISGQSNAISGNPNANHHVSLTLQGNGNTLLLDTLFKGYDCVSKKFNLNGNLFTSTSALQFASINDLAAQSDFNTTPFIKCKYTRTSNFTNEKSLKFKLQNLTTSNLLFSNIQLDSILLFQPQQKKYYTPILKNDSVYYGLGANNTHQDYIIASIKQNDLSNNYVVEKCNIIAYDFTNEENELIIISSLKLESSAKEYEQYKESKGTTTLLVFAEDLYNRYTYGYHHPIAIKRFIENYSSTAKALAKNVFILGKGMQSNTYMDANVAPRDLVPAVGVPPADVLYVSSFNYNPIIPSMGIGRLTAENHTEVLNYLDKIKDNDALAQGEQWRKNIIHATGGRSISENNTFTAALKTCEGIAVQPAFGAHITNFNKKVNEPITDNYREQIVALTDQGISLLTYFGHGANYFVEINFGEPEALNNKGKYPIYFLNGCSVGNSALDNSLGENYIHAKNRGAIGWLASSDEGFSSYLSLFDQYFYENAFRLKYGQTIGEIHKETIKKFINPNDSLSILHARQYFYQGDPSVTFYSPEKPDYNVNSNSLFTTPKAFVNNDSIEFACIITNPGKAISDSIEIKIERSINNQVIAEIPIYKIGPIFNKDTTYFTLAKTKAYSGTNTVKINIDPENKLDELNKTNNATQTEVYISSYSPTIVQPRNSSVLKENTLNLVVQCNDIYAKDVEYIVELDTVNTFSSAYLKTFKWVEQQLLIKRILLTGNIHQTYYLRVKIKGNNQESEWQNSSFKYIPNNTNAWLQNDIRELNAGLFTNTYIEGNKLAFINNTVEIAINTRGDNARTDSVERRIRFNNNPPVYINSGITGIALIALHPKNLNRFSYESAYNLFANTPDYPFELYRRSGLYVFNTNSATDRDSLLHYLQSIPAGYVVSGYNGLNANLKNLPENLLQAFETLGLAKIRTINNSEPYAFAGYKGSAIGTASELISDASSSIPVDKQFIRLNFTHTGKWDRGSIRSEIIGPIKKYKSINWNFTKEPTDEFNLQIFGIDANGNKIILVTSQNLIDSISASFLSSNNFKKIQLVSNFKDSINFSPPVFNSWGLRYDLPTEASVLPQYNYVLNPTKTAQGDTITYQFSFINIGEENIDTASFVLNSIDENRKSEQIQLDTIYAFKSLDTLTKAYKIPTRNYIGKVTLQNKINNLSGEDLIPFNNSYESNINIERDVKSPRLTVLIDGKTPMQNDIISPNPLISINLKDENKFLLLKDSSNVELYLKRPGTSTFAKVNYSNPDLTFTPASSANANELKLSYQPKLADDGLYSLKVKVKDASNNTNQNSEYAIDFEVINASTITHFFPYPNPFTTQTQFVFTLTGEVVPEDIKIQIMTISGKIVKEIRKSELGALKIGHNITDYRWNGTDEYGNRLANGVYLYRVILKDKNGFTGRETSADKYFKQGFGKIYLMK